MHAEIFLDTNILLYAASGVEAEKAKRAVARDLLAHDRVGLSVQVLAEFYVNAVGKLKLPEEQVAKVLRSLGGYPVLPITEAVFWSALAIRKRYRISYHGQIYAGVTIVNPFRD
jgi:predicted nucleic acid-binding protein